MDMLKPPVLVSGQYIYQPLSFKAVQRMYGDEEGSSFRCVSSELTDTFNPFKPNGHSNSYQSEESIYKMDCFFHSNIKK